MAETGKNEGFSLRRASFVRLIAFPSLRLWRCRARRFDLCTSCLGEVVVGYLPEMLIRDGLSVAEPICRDVEGVILDQFRSTGRAQVLE